MAKTGTTPLEQTSRLLDLVPFLLSHQGISLADLAKYFKVETDVMLDDLNTLWMCGLPGYTPLELMDLDFESGYVTIRNAPTLAKPRSITHEEGVALVLGLDVLRSTISPEREDLIDAIDAGHMAGATLDVFREEPLPQGHAFWTHPQITVTPHTSARTLREESIAQIAGKIKAVYAGQAIEGRVDKVRGY